MKKQLTFVIIFCAMFAFTNAQDERYIKAMEKNIAMLDSASNENTLLEASNGFERIAAANEKEWLPLYYQAYATTRAGFMQKDKMKMDEAFTKAEGLINKANDLSPDNSEIYVVRSFVTGAQIMIDPMSRGQKLGMISSGYIQKAISLDPENPRAYYLQGQSLFYTPAQFGGGADKALPLIEKAVAKYETFKPKDSISPNWGKSAALESLKAVKNAIQPQDPVPNEQK